DRRLALSARRGVRDLALGGAPRSPRFRGSRALPARALGERPGAPVATLRLLPVRRWAARLHRQPLRHDGGQAGPGHGHPALLLRTDPRDLGEPAAERDAAPAGRRPPAPRGAVTGATPRNFGARGAGL